MKKSLPFGLLIFIASYLLISCGGSREAEVSHEPVKTHTTKKKVVKKEVAITKPNRAESKSIAEKYAKILSLPESHIKRNIELYQFIDNWIGTPYKYGGTTQAGIDCSGLMQMCYSVVYRKEIPRDAGSQFKQCQTVKQSNLTEGDLVFFKIGSKNITHVGLYLANGKFAHASTSKGVMISDLNEKYYKKYFYIGGRIRE